MTPPFRIEHRCGARRRWRKNGPTSCRPTGSGTSAPRGLFRCGCGSKPTSSIAPRSDITYKPLRPMSTVSLARPDWRRDPSVIVAARLRRRAGAVTPTSENPPMTKALPLLLMTSALLAGCGSGAREAGPVPTAPAVEPAETEPAASTSREGSPSRRRIRPGPRAPPRPRLLRRLCASPRPVAQTACS